MDTVLDQSPDSPAPRRAFGALGWLLVLAVLAAGSYGAWRAWHLVAPVAEVVWSGDLAPQWYDSSAQAQRAHCPRCG